MNKAERIRLLRLYDCLNTISGLGPSNPMDLKMTVEAWRTVQRAAVPILRALGAIGRQDWLTADEYLDQAEHALVRSANDK